MMPKDMEQFGLVKGQRISNQMFIEITKLKALEAQIAFERGQALAKEVLDEKV